MAHLGSVTRSGNDSIPRETDRLTSLPSEILHNIFSFLPMKQSVSTSILSSRWRHLWTHNPNLDFHFLPFEQQDPLPIVDHCLSLYNRPTLNRLNITLFSNQDFSQPFDSWIRFAISRSVRELCLKIFASDTHSRLPSFFFLYTHFADLVLASSIFRPPKEFKGFPCLKFLQLFDVIVTDKTVRTLLLTCPLLMKLSLMSCDVLKNLRISHNGLKFLELGKCKCLKKLSVDVPSLKSFKFCGEQPIQICLKHVPGLMEAEFTIWGNLDIEEVDDRIPLVESMARVTSFRVSGWLTQFVFAKYCVLKAPRIAFINLMELHWSGDLNCEYEVLALATFMRDCPLLEKLCINLEYENLMNIIRGDWYSRYYECAKDFIPHFKGIIRSRSRKDGKRYLKHLDYTLLHLKTIEIVGFSGTKVEMDLVRFLLDKAVALGSFILTSISEDGDEDGMEEEMEDWGEEEGKYKTRSIIPCIPRIPNWQLREKLLHLPKTSEGAEILLLEASPDPLEQFLSGELEL